MKILITEKISPTGLDLLKKSGIDFTYEPDAGEQPQKLKQLIRDASALIVRSTTQVTADLITCAGELKVIGRAGIGVDNIDVMAASKKGIIVMNTPAGNVITTAEHAIALLCALTRNIPQATHSLKSGKWEKSRFIGTEIYHKKLGIIGCGNIGKTVANRALGLKMKVLAYDPYLSDEIAKEIGVEKVELNELFKQSDYITVHTPLNDKTRHLIAKDAFKKMKKGVYIINCARGGIVKEDDLLWAIEKEIVSGAALDVFEKEPVEPNHPLLKSDRVIATPHLGASTEEAQENVAIQIIQQIADFLRHGTITNAVNTMSASAEMLKVLGPAIELGNKIGTLHGQLCENPPQEIHMSFYGEITKHETAPVTTAILQGILRHMLSDVSVNTVNAPYLAKERGITIRESKITTHSDYSMMIEVSLTANGNTRVIGGSIFGKTHLRIVRFDNIYPELNPKGQILIIENADKPGVVGKVGTFLGGKGVNISNMQLWLDKQRKIATGFYLVQGDASEQTLSELRKLDGLVSVHKVIL